MVDDSVLFDTKIENEHDLKVLDKPKVNNDAMIVNSASTRYPYPDLI